MTAPLLYLLTLRLRFTRNVCFGTYLHGHTLAAMLGDRLHSLSEVRVNQSSSSILPLWLRPIAPERGRVNYRAGDDYVFGLMLLPEAPLPSQTWEQILCRSPRKSEHPPILGDNFDLVEVRNALSREKVYRRCSGPALCRAQVEAAASSLVGCERLHVRIVSPLRISLPTPDGYGPAPHWGDPRKRTTMNLGAHAFSVQRFLQQVAKAASALCPEWSPTASLPSANLLVNHLVRAEQRLGPRPKRPRGTTIAGSVGEFVLALDEPLNLCWARALVAAGLWGAGMSTGLGYGHFLVNESVVSPYWPPQPAATHCQRAAKDHVLMQAREAIRRGGPSAGVDGIGRDEFLEDVLTYREPILRDALAIGRAKASPLQGVLIPKRQGGVRALAIPTMADRFLQRACHEVLYPAVDTLLEDSSYAYRQGISRSQARREVERSYADFPFVLDADVRSFFDEVHWELLQARLEAYLGPDPVVAQLMRWVRAPIHFRDHHIERQAGLPQGVAVSPLLANLYLDVFDEAIEARGFRLIRYADDFLVLCQSPEELERAHCVVEEELGKLRLELQNEKTKRVSFDQGFDFIGYSFAKSTSVEMAGSKRQGSHARESELDDDELRLSLGADAPGWLGAMLAKLKASDAESKSPSPRAWQRPVVLSSVSRRPAYVVSQDIQLSGSRRGLRVHREGRLLEELGWDTLSEIVVLGGRAMSASLFQHAMRQRVPVSFYSRSGEPQGVVLPARARQPSALTRAHFRWHETQTSRLLVALSLVEAKLHHQRHVAKTQPGPPVRLREQLALLKNSVKRAQTVQELRGLEGRGAALYFREFQHWVPANLGFENRSGRHAKDPVNAVLNLLYTQLFRRCWVSLLAQGLDAHLGLLHEPSDEYASLAADMQEPFRFLCDRLTIELFRRGSLQKRDFVRHEKQFPPVRLTPEALKRVLGLWEARLQVETEAGGVKRSYSAHIDAQSRALSDLVRGNTAEFAAFRIKW